LNVLLPFWSLLLMAMPSTILRMRFSAIRQRVSFIWKRARRSGCKIIGQPSVPARRSGPPLHRLLRVPLALHAFR
jgi:hypothetical protein